MAIKLITPAAGLPLSVDQVKAQSRITYTDAAQDDLIALYLQQAVNYAQLRLSRQLMTATFKYYVDEFPRGGRALELPIAPVQSVTSIEYIAESGELTEWDAAGYVVDVVSEPARICPVYQASWPVIQPTLNAVVVTFVAGYGNAAAVPAEFKQAIAMLAAHAYETREATADVKLMTAPFGVDDLLDLQRWHPNSFATL